MIGYIFLGRRDFPMFLEDDVWEGVVYQSYSSTKYLFDAILLDEKQTSRGGHFSKTIGRGLVPRSKSPQKQVGI